MSRHTPEHDQVQSQLMKDLQARVDLALDAPGVDRVRLALNAMAYLSGIAAGELEREGRGKITSATLLSAVLQSEIISGGMDRMAFRARRH